MKKQKQNKGITLISLIVTVVVTLIIAGITIATLTSKNGLIEETNNSISEKNKSEEEEAVTWAAAQAVSDSDIGVVTQAKLAQYLDEYLGEGKDNGFDYQIDDGYNDILVVEFLESGNEYTIDLNGRVYEEVRTDFEGIYFDNTTVTIEVGEKIKLNPVTSSTSLKWKVSNSNIAEVDNDGVVEGKAIGRTVVTVTTEKGKSAECTVIVQQSPTGLILDPKDITIDLSDSRTVQIGTTVLPATVNVDIDIQWSSSDESVATVNDNGIVTGVANGTAIITATCNGKVTDTSTVQVLTSPINVSLGKSREIIDLNKATTSQLTATISPSTANKDTELTWTSSNESVAVVNSNGLITAKANGNTIITVTTANGKSATYNLTCMTSITAITISPVSKMMEIGETLQIESIVEPSTATEKVSWVSSNTNVLIVDDNGFVTAKGSGNATITAKNPDGTITATCKILVIPTVTTNSTYSVQAWYRDVYVTECHDETYKDSYEVCEDNVNTVEWLECDVQCETIVEYIEAAATANVYESCTDNGCETVSETQISTDCHTEYVTKTREVCEEVYAGQELVSDSATITFKLSSYFDKSNLKLVKEGIGAVSVGSINVSNSNTATYTIRISTSSTSFSSGKLKLYYDDGEFSAELYTWNITCQ